MQEFMIRFEHPPGKENPVGDALSRGVTETKKTLTNEPIIAQYKKPCAKTTASANPVILRNEQDLRECTTPGCEAYARGNAHGLCQGCWATAYDKRRNELLGGGVSWQDAANNVKEVTT